MAARNAYNVVGRKRRWDGICACVAFFRDYQIFLSVLKVDLQFGVSLILMSGFFLLPTESYQLWINITVIFLSFAWAAWGWQAVRFFLGGSLSLFASFSPSLLVCVCLVHAHVGGVSRQILDDGWLHRLCARTG